MNEKLKYNDEIWFYPFMLTLLLWLVKGVELRYNFYFVANGIMPRKFTGLQGVFFAPFIHADLKHLWANTIPFFVTSMFIYYFYKELFWKILWYSLLFTGLLTWIIARQSYHIGVSGVIYANVSFLFFGGVFSKNFRLMAVSLLIVFLYGGMLWYVFPTETGISWEGHLSGLLVGLLFAFLYKKRMLKPEKKYSWEKQHYKPENDEFMQYFDEDGNFIDPPKEAPLTDETSTITYDYKPKED